MENKLLPCPFCGGEAETQNTYAIGVWEVFCIVCGAHTGYHPGGCTEAEAIEAWNTRHEKTCDGCRHLATSMRVDYHIDPCCECVRNAPDLYEPKEGADAD